MVVAVLCGNRKRKKIVVANMAKRKTPGKRKYKVIGYHVTNLENLSSILDEGIEARRTTENNFPFALDNGYRKKVFFMTNLNSSNLWAQCHHRWVANCTDDEKENGLYSADVLDDDEMVIIEFNSPYSYIDPYAWGETNYMKDSRFTVKDISPRDILDIYEVEEGNKK